MNSKNTGSIARKLSGRMFRRVLGTMLSIDILILILVSVSAVYYCESKAIESYRYLWEGTDRPATGVTLAPPPAETHGIIIPEPLRFLLPEETGGAARRIAFAGTVDGNPTRHIESLSYEVYLTHNGETMLASVDIEPFVFLFRFAFAVLLAFELLNLIFKSIADRRKIRHILAPISELARATKSLEEVSAHFDPEKMAALAGKLEGIDAERLDTRIQVDETQRELRSLATAINGMLDRINESYRAQARFVSDASHELRTPISVIQGYANMLDRWGKEDEKTLQEGIAAIKEEAESMKTLVEQLLFLARGDNNTITLIKETFDAAELIDEVAAETKMIDTEHTVQVQTEHAMIKADRALIKQALRVLTDNAAKYTDAGGAIKIAVKQDGGNAILSVSDDGIGVPPEVLPRIFDRFVRADTSRARSTGGAGLGLAIASLITARHGGRMEAVSREKIGSRISIILPIADNSENAGEHGSS